MKKLVILLSAVAVLLSSGSALAVDILPTCEVRDGNGKCIQAGGCTDPIAKKSPACQQAAQQKASGSNPIAGPDGLLQKAANLIAVLTGIIGVIIIIAGGITVMTAGGAPGGQRAGDNPNRIKKAQSMIFAAIGGMVVVALAWTIVTFVVQRFIK